MFLPDRPSTLATDLVNTRGLDFRSLAPVRYTEPNSYQMKCIITTIGFLFLVHCLGQAQGWGVTLFEGQIDDVVTDSNGNFYGIGREGEHAISFKLNKEGQLVWKKQLPGRWGRAITLLSNNELGMVGQYQEGTAFDTIRTIFIARLDLEGNTQWTQEFNHYFSEEVYQILETPNNDLLVLGAYREAPSSTHWSSFLLRLDQQGNAIAKTDFARNRTTSNRALVATLSGDYWMTSSDTLSDLSRINGEGELLETLTFNPRTSGLSIFPYKIIPENDGNIIVVQAGELDEVYLTRIDREGDVRMNKTFSPFDNLIRGVFEVTSSNDGNYVIGFSGFDGELEGETSEAYIQLIKVDVNGNKLWEKRYSSNIIDGLLSGIILKTLKVTPDGGFIMAGRSLTQALLIKTEANGNLFSKFIEGRVILDENQNCVSDESDLGLQNWTIKVQGQERAYYTTTNEEGEYEFNLPVGDYLLSAVPPSAYWANSCENEYAVNLTAADSTLEVSIPVSPIIDCPLIAVHVATNRLRRCFPNTYVVDYCNKGTIAGEDIYIDLTLDEFLIVDSTDLPYTPLENNVYRFPIGAIEVGECGEFKVHTTLTCDLSIPLGQVHCVEAHAFPDSLCLPPNQNWDGSSIDVSASCRSDTVFFNIGNFGEGNMSAPLNYIVIEDQIILHEKSFQLEQGAYLIDTIVGFSERRYTMLAQQSEGSPGNAFPNVTMVNCVASSLGVSVDLPADPGSPFRGIHCQENIDSYDPNDKRGWPMGFGEEQIIFPNTEIEYMIRFQNTGTDTAYKVVISDPLPTTLDVTSLSLGASSHPYNWSIEDNNSLTFTFNNILLPDSTTNLEASQGFVSFTLQQQADLALGTTITNTAAIYFDFNDPIYTNTSRHKVGTLFSQALVATPDLSGQNLGVKVYPNPFSKTTSFRIEKVKPQAVRLHLYDLSGRLIRIADYATTNFQFDRAALANGLYTYQLILADGSRGHGKIAIVD